MALKNIYSLGKSFVLIFVLALIGCVSHASPNPVARQAPIRIILYFQQAVSESRLLTEAVADSCYCEPVFIRPDGGNALIYEVALPQGQIFATLEKSLMKHSGELGIKLIEQDRILQHQQRLGNDAQAPAKALILDAK